jgi:hypothetical protein
LKNLKNRAEDRKKQANRLRKEIETLKREINDVDDKDDLKQKIVKNPKKSTSHNFRKKRTALFATSKNNSQRYQNIAWITNIASAKAKHNVTL